jgi:hypothetical protein
MAAVVPTIDRGYTPSTEAGMDFRTLHERARRAREPPDTPVLPVRSRAKAVAESQENFGPALLVSRRQDMETQPACQLFHPFVECHNFNRTLHICLEKQRGGNMDRIKRPAVGERGRTLDDFLNRSIYCLETERIKNFRQKAEPLLRPSVGSGAPLEKSCPTNGNDAFDPEQARGEPFVRALPQLADRWRTLLNEQFSEKRA